jgi:chromosome segregation ATPase
MANDILQALQSSRYTLAQLRNVLDNPPSWMTDRQLRTVAAGVAKYERQERTKQLSGVKKSVEQQTEQQARLLAALDEAAQDVALIRQGVRDGEYDPQGAEHAIKVILRDVRGYREALDRIEGSTERIQEVADLDPAVWQAQRIERFPSLANALPVINSEWFTGEDKEDPFRSRP